MLSLFHHNNNYIDLARAKSEAAVNINLLFKSNHKLVIHKSVNFRADSYIHTKKSSNHNPLITVDRLGKQIGHFQVPKTLTFKRRLGALPFL